MALSLLAAASAWSPTPEGHEPPSFTRMISLMANEAFSTSQSGSASDQHVHMAATPHSVNLGHAMTRGAVNLAANAFETMPDYLIAVIMVSVVVLVFALLWCVLSCRALPPAEQPPGSTRFRGPSGSRPSRAHGHARWDSASRMLPRSLTARVALVCRSRW